MGKITYADKDKTAAVGTPQKTWRDADANEVKTAVNLLYDMVDALATTVSGIASSLSKSYNFNLVDQNTVQHPKFVGLDKKDLVVIFESSVISATATWVQDAGAYDPLTGTITLQSNVTGELIVIIIKSQN